MTTKGDIIMGLTIHWTLRLRDGAPNGNSPGKALEALRQKALDLPFEDVSRRVYHVVGDAANYERYRENDPSGLFWPLCQAVAHIEPEPRVHLGVVPVEAFIFKTWPGEGCESANFGLARYPTKVQYHGAHVSTGLRGWRWESFCKTQYASQVGMGHFLRCHAAVCSLLQYAERLGLVKAVHDEGGFYGNGDFQSLANEVGQWNGMIASLVKELRQAFAGTDVSISSPIDPSDQPDGDGNGAGRDGDCP